MTSHRNINLSRRGLIVAAAVGAVTAAAGASQAQAARFSRITIDVSDLKRVGLGPYADFVQVELGRAMQVSFAGRVGGNGPAVVVRVAGITLTALGDLGGGGGGLRGGGSGGEPPSDYMDGEALIVSGSTVLQRYPQLMALPSSSGGNWAIPGGEQRRTRALCDAYAAWLARAF